MLSVLLTLLACGGQSGTERGGDCEVVERIPLSGPDDPAAVAHGISLSVLLEATEGTWAGQLEPSDGGVTDGELVVAFSGASWELVDLESDVGECEDRFEVEGSLSLVFDDVLSVEDGAFVQLVASEPPVLAHAFERGLVAGSIAKVFEAGTWQSETLELRLSFDGNDASGHLIVEQLADEAERQVPAGQLTLAR